VGGKMKPVNNIGQINSLSWREKIRKRSRELRKTQTESEKILWQILRDRKTFGLKFLRQHPILYDFYEKPYYFIADFYCVELKLVIELDGSIHDNRQEFDEQRTLILNEKGLRVVRIKNEELSDPKRITEKIKHYLK